MPVPQTFTSGALGVGHKVIGKLHAYIEVPLSGTISKNCLALNVSLLVDVQFRLLHQGAGCTTDKGEKDNGGRVHV